MGVRQDYARAEYWFRKAADQGNAVAKNNLGKMYHSGLGVDKDLAEALFWYRQAADQGNVAALDNINSLQRNVPSLAAH